MATTVLTDSPKQHFDDSNGNPAVGYQLFTYTAGTTTKLVTYTDSSGGTANTDPIILDARGEANVWLPYGSSYKFVLAPPTDTDPPTNPVWTVDNIAAASALAFQPASNVVITGGNISGTTLSDNPSLNITRSLSELDITNSTTLESVSGLSVALTAGAKYVISGHLSVLSDAAGGLQAALVASGGLTATTISVSALAWAGTTIEENTTVAALGSNFVASTTAITDVYFTGAIDVNVAGTLLVQAAQNVADATSTKVLINSTFRVERVSN